jgi:hypothetical protein
VAFINAHQLGGPAAAPLGDVRLPPNFVTSSIVIDELPPPKSVQA